MNWYNYIACLFAGIFLSNAVPHFIHGISGNKFPTPFAKPPGKGLSSPMTNILWAFFNIIVGIFLLWFGIVKECTLFTFAVILFGAFIISIILSIRFQNKDKEVR